MSNGHLVGVILALSLAIPASAADSPALEPITLRLSADLAAAVRCPGEPRVERVSGTDSHAARVLAFAEDAGACSGRIGIEAAGPGESGTSYLPTRILADGTWVGERDGARLVRALSPAMRDQDFHPAEALGTRGPARIEVAGREAGEPEGFVVTVDDPELARWYRSATAWVADPDRIATASGTSALATCSGLHDACRVTVPVCGDVSVEYVARGVYAPAALGPAIRRAHAEAAAALGCGIDG